METIQTYNPDQVVVTDTAKQHLLDQIYDNDALGVSLGLMPGGCSGFEFTWKFVSEYLSQNNFITDLDDYKVLIIDSVSMPMLKGSTIDLLDEGIKGKTITVKSPLSNGTCGCGESINF
jgi:iron-sulfur cluster assembly accessory protein